MFKEKIIRNYTNSLFELATDATIEKIIYKELIQVVDIILSSDKLYNFFCSPIVLGVYKQKIMDIVVSKLKCNKLLIQFLHILVDNMRINFINDIKDHYYNLLLASQGVKIVEVISAKKLTNQQLENIKKYLEAELNNIVEINTDIDESLISGMVVKYDSILLDCSVVGMLQKIKTKVARY